MSRPPRDHAVRVLVVDDDPVLLRMVERTLARVGHRVATAGDAERGLDLARDVRPEVVITDLVLPGMDGIEFLSRLRSTLPGCEIVLMTAFATLERAIEAMRLGAYDFVEKPIDRGRLLRTVAKAAEKQSLLSENTRLRARLGEDDELSRLVGTSPAMAGIRQTVAQFAATESTVLITGESGTGKEVVADLLHALSPRAGGPLIKISCAAIPENLLESELFGYEKGAFSGALAAKAGRFELADRGTLFLDEIGEMPAGMQAKLLRVLQDGCVQRLGSTRDIRCDVRVLAATNVDVDRALRAGRLREDLYHRLSVFEIQLPPLRERLQDIPVLAAHFLRQYAARRKTPLERLSPAAVRVLLQHAWPGNVRELENVIQRAVAMAPGPEVEEGDIQLTAHAGIAAAPRAAPEGVFVPYGLKMREAEDLLIEDALRRSGGNKERAAQLLGVSARTLSRRSKRGGREDGASPAPQSRSGTFRDSSSGPSASGSRRSVR